MNQTYPVAPVQLAAQPAGEGCVSILSWHAASFVLPAASLSFYRRAVSRSVGSAVLFFVLFMGIITLISTVGLARGMSQFSTDIRQVFQTGRMPEITISEGVATVKGQQPAVLFDQNGSLFVVDTTGRYSSIDQARYTSSILLTRTELQVLSTGGRYQVIPLSQLQQVFNQDPLVINAETTARLWQNLTGLFAIIALVGLAFWNLGIRLVYLAALALMMWGGTALFRLRTPFGVVFTIGVYAFVPVVYLVEIIDRLGKSFFLLQTLLLIVVWTVGLVVGLARNGRDMLGPDRPLRAWRAWMGLPLLIVLALDGIFSWLNGGWFDLITAVLTGILLLIAGLYTRPRSEPDASLPTGDAGAALPPPAGVA